MSGILAFDIGGTKISWAVINEQGKIVRGPEKEKTPPSKEGIEALLRRVIASYEAEAEGVAISTAGTVDHDNRRITGSIGNLPKGYGDIDFQNLSVKPVMVENDANAAMWAVYKVGNAKGKNDAVMLTLGTGVGVGIIAEGKLLKGKSGAAGEVHFPVRQDHRRLCGCGHYDCLEIYMSGRALNLNAKEAYHDEAATSYDVIEGLKNGDPPAVAAFDKWQKYVLDGIVIFATVFDPEVILLGGSMAKFIDYKRLEEEANRRIVSSPFSLRPAAFENDAGLIGAGLLAFEKLKG